MRGWGHVGGWGRPAWGWARGSRLPQSHHRAWRGLQAALCSSPRRYRLLALENHPQKCKEPLAQERFRLLAEAYDVLSDRKQWGLNCTE